MTPLLVGLMVLLIVALAIAVLLIYLPNHPASHSLRQLGRRLGRSQTVTVIQNGEELQAPVPRHTTNISLAGGRLLPFITGHRTVALVVAILIGVLAIWQIPHLMMIQPDQFVVLVAPFRDPGGDLGSGRAAARQLADLLPQASGGRVGARAIEDAPTTMPEALALMQRANADALVLGNIEAGGLLDQESLQPVLIYRPTGPFAPAALEGYSARFALPSVYVLTSAPINGQAVLPRLLAALADYAAGRYDGAVAGLDDLTSTYPALTPALPRSVRGNLLWARGEYQAAANEYQRIGLLDPQVPPSPELAQLANNLGAILQDANDPAADSAFARAVQLLNGQDLGELRMNLGLQALSMGRAADAVGSLEQARRLLPPTTPLDLALAQAYRANRQFDRAGQLLADAGQQITVDVAGLTRPLGALASTRLNGALAEQRALLGLARGYNAYEPLLWELLSGGVEPRMGGLSANALTDIQNTLRSAVEASDDLMRRWQRGSAAQEAAGDPIAGLIATGQARRAETTLAVRQRLLASVQIELARAERYKPPQGFAALWSGLTGDRSPVGQARTTLTRLLNAQPGDAVAGVMLGRALLLSGRQTEAAQQFDQTAANAPGQPEPLYGQALVADNNRARQLLLEALQIEPRFFPARERLAQVAPAQDPPDWTMAIEQRRALVGQRPGPENSLALARVLRLSGQQNYQEAERVLLPLANENNPTALLELGRLYSSYGAIDAARAALDRATAVAPGNPEVAYELGQVLVAQGDRRGAESQFRIALQANPNSIDAHLALAKLYIDNRPQEAAREYRAALDAGVNDPTALKQIGTVLMDRGDYATALTAFQRAVEAAPKDPTAYHGLAQANLRRNQLDAAQTAEEQALNLNNQVYPDALVGLGDIALQRGQTQAAVERYNTALQQNNRLTAAYIGLGRAAFAEGNWSVAQAYFQDAINRDPRSAEAQLWLGEALVRQNSAGAAIEAYNNALALKPDYAEASFGLAQAQFIARQTSAAQASLNNALRQRPNYAEALLLQGKIYEQQSRLNDAIEVYGSSIKANENLAEPYYRRGLLYIRADRISDARRDLERSVRVQNNFPEAHYWLGRAYMVEGRTQEARDQFQMAVDQRNGNYAEARFYQGVAEEQLGQRSAAIESYRSALQLAPSTALAGEVQTALTRLGQ